MFKLIMRILLTITSFVGGFELFRVTFPSLMVVTGIPLPLPPGVWFPVIGGTIFGLIFYFRFISISVGKKQLK